MQIVIIFNPVAGKGKGKTLAAKLSRLLKERHHQVKLLPTHPDPEIFKTQCRELNPATTVIVVGGDGTLRYFIQTKSKPAAVAFYGTGTANVLRAEFGLPRNLHKFADMVEQGHCRHIKPGVGDGDQWFLMMWSMGFDSYILNNARQDHKNMFGKLAFLLPAFKGAFRYKFPSFQIQWDDQEPQTAFFAIVSRIRYYAGSFLMAPEADPEGDHFEILLLKKPGFRHFFTFFVKLVLGQVKTNRIIFQTSAKRVVCHPGNAENFSQIDGDAVSKSFKTLTISDQTIPFITPKL